jgi:UDP-2,3-diacylglucosamine hydrolase
MKILLTSDVHLKLYETKKQDKFLKHLENTIEKENIKDVIFAGDIFDIFLGKKKYIINGYKNVIESFIRLRNLNINFHYVEGNHDFHLKPFFEKELGFNIYSNYLDKNFYGKRIFCSHGDTINKFDFWYLAFRKFTRNRFFFWLIDIFPERLMCKIASFISTKSKHLPGEKTIKYKLKSKSIKNLRKFAESLLSNGFDAVFLGHTHYREETKENNSIYVNLGEYSKNGFFIFEDK